MKVKNIWALLIIFVVTLPACDDEFEKMNTSPNDVTEIDDEYLFAQAVMATLDNGGDGNNCLYFPFGSQYANVYVGTSSSRYIDTYQDNFTSAEYKWLFEYFYYGPIRHIKEVLLFTQPGGENDNEIRYAMAQIISDFNFIRLADAYGSVPYSDGGYGQKEILYPAYDDVEFIYKDVIEKLGNAVELLKTADPKNAYPGADPLFNNDLKKWAKFANSLRLRIAMRIRFIEPQLAQSTVLECLNNALIEENEDNAWKEYFDSDIVEFRNPVYFHYTKWNWKMSEKFVETLKTSNDPRLNVFVEPNSNGEYIGIPNGLSDNAFAAWNWELTSNPGSMLVGKEAPGYLMSAAELWLLRAEAALYNIIDDDANALYRKGLQASFEQWGCTQVEIDAYLNDPAYGNLSGTLEEQFEQIATQIWITTMPDAHESWCSVRRTGYPKNPIRTAPDYIPGVTGGIMPKRLKYPSSESNINRNNYLKALEKQGPDEISTALWWDVKD